MPRFFAFCSKLQVSPIFGFSKASNAIESMAKERGDFCTHWDEGDNTVIIEKKNHTNYLITLNPGKTLFKVDRYLPDFNFSYFITKFPSVFDSFATYWLKV